MLVLKRSFVHLSYNIFSCFKTVLVFSYRTCMIISIFLETFCTFSRLCHGTVLSDRERVKRRYNFTKLTP